MAESPVDAVRHLHGPVPACYPRCVGFMVARSRDAGGALAFIVLQPVVSKLMHQNFAQKEFAQRRWLPVDPCRSERIVRPNRCPGVQKAARLRAWQATAHEPRRHRLLEEFDPADGHKSPEKQSGPASFCRRLRQRDLANAVEQIRVEQAQEPQHVTTARSMQPPGAGGRFGHSDTQRRSGRLRFGRRWANAEPIDRLPTPASTSMTIGTRRSRIENSANGAYDPRIGVQAAGHSSHARSFDNLGPTIQCCHFARQRSLPSEQRKAVRGLLIVLIRAITPLRHEAPGAVRLPRPCSRAHRARTC